MTIKDIIELETKLTHMFDSDQRVAMALLEHIRNNKKEMLEKEKETMCFFTEYWSNSMQTIEEAYNKTFKTKQR